MGNWELGIDKGELVISFYLLFFETNNCVNQALKPNKAGFRSVLKTFFPCFGNKTSALILKKPGFLPNLRVTRSILEKKSGSRTPAPKSR
ncbi:MAG: hypothetical protein HC942_10550 [Microcoleus sp. SU_5_6]|nr:hypothetical protein [Microcoleus sp. SU_5_6]